MRTKKPIYIGAIAICLVVVVLMLAFQAHFYSESYALQKATEKMHEFSRRKQLDLARMNGPWQVEINVPWGFEWHYEGGEERHLIGVNIYSSGEVEVYSAPIED